ncbi:MAG: YraN family protein [Planctomycetota bacterium]
MRLPWLANPGRSSNASTGQAGERAAERFLRRQGYRVVDRNLHIGPGEADLVCLAPDARTLVIVEVKAKRRDDRDRTPPPEANITATKRRTLAGIARAVVRRTNWRGRPVRIDVVAVDLPPSGAKPIDVRHYAAAVRA